MSSTNQQENSRRALITGGAMGLGKALADQLVKDGWHVTTIDREANQLPEPDEPRQHYRVDLSDKIAVIDLLERLQSQAPFDLVILNAARSASGKFEEIPLSAYENLLTLNAEIPIIMASTLARNGCFKKGSNLVFVSSLSHFTGYPGAAVYGASKDVVATYAKSIRKPFAKHQIAVSCVFPGPLQTAQAARHSPANASEEKRMSPEIAAAMILKSVFAGKSKIFPGFAPRAFAMFGKLVPGFADRTMRKIIHEKLDRNVF